jgi:membrane-bound serine protease (ClpP class)
MADIWPDEPIDWAGGTFAIPLLNMVIGMAIAIVGAVIFARILPKTWVWNKLVLQTAVGDPPRGPQHGATGANAPFAGGTPSGWPDVGAIGVAVSDLFPNGEVEIDSQRYQAKCRLGQIEHGTRIVVVGYQDFSLTVEPASEKELHHG